MKHRNHRRTIKPGSTWKEMQRSAEIRKQMDNERAHHSATKYDLMMQRRIAVMNTNAGVMALELARIARKEIDEDRRHQAKMDALTSRIRKP